MVLKIVGFKTSDADKLPAMRARMRFAHHLEAHGVHIAAPVAGADGALYAEAEDGDLRFVAYRMAFRAGHNPQNEELTPEFARVWGGVTGKAHRAARSFTDETPGLDFTDELRGFTAWCRDQDGKRAWARMGEALSALPRDAGGYGFIHNDNHQQNILADAGRVTLIDFDCACRQFLIQDITTPVQGLLFGEVGGMFGPVTDPGRLNRFFDAFLEGYEQEHHLDDFWTRRIDDFINYRRLLLFTCLQDWLDTRPDVKTGLLKNIEDPPRMRA